MNASRRVGRYTKHENAELLRMFGEGYSVYKICKNLNRSQKSIRNNLIRLGKIEGEITPIQTPRYSSSISVDWRSKPTLWSKLSYGFILTSLSILFVIHPHYNILELIITYILMFVLIKTLVKKNMKILKTR